MASFSWPAARPATKPARFIALLLCAAAVVAALASRAEASVGYELDSAHPSASLSGLLSKGFAVDQATGDVYVAIVSTNLTAGAGGEILRFNSDLSTDGTFAKGGGFYSGVALDPGSGGFVAVQMELRTAFGNFGASKLDRFDSTGASTGSFPISFSDSLPPIAVDAAGHIYVPNVTTHTVQAYSSAGTLLEEITCAGCTGGSFGMPASVAIDGSGNLYVVDVNPDRVVKLAPSGGSFAFSSLVQSGRGAGAVAVDPGSGDVVVGDMPGGNDFHIVAYDSSGNQFDDFGAGMFPDITAGGYGVLSAYQMAVNGKTHKLYVGSEEEFYAFEKATISPPSATIEPISGNGQLSSNLNAMVDPHGHAVLKCEFEYTGESDFLANGFTNASSVPCAQKPGGSGDAPVGAHVSGLSPSSKYRYRVTAANNGGSVTSDDEAFETLPELPPTVTAEAAQAVTQNEAKLKAKVNPHGGSVSDCHFELGTSIAYGTSFSCLTPPTGATIDVSETRLVTGLSPGTAYHYRLVVTTNAGTAEGDDVEFTTASPPAEPEPEKSPPSDPAPAPGGSTPSPPAPGPIVTPPPPTCKKGFKRVRINGQVRCVKVCPKGSRRKLSGGRVRCVRKKHATRRRSHG